MSDSVERTSFGKSVSSMALMNSLMLETHSFTFELSFSINCIAKEEENRAKVRTSSVKHDPTRPGRTGLVQFGSIEVVLVFTCLCSIHSWWR